MSERYFLAIRTAIAIVALLILRRLYNKLQRPQFPVVNEYAQDWTHGKAYGQNEGYARGPIANGLEQHNGPIIIPTPAGLKVVLPNSLAEWVKDNKDLDHQKVVKDDFFSDYSGFDSLTTMNSADHLMINVIKTKISKTKGVLPVLETTVAVALQDQLA